MLSKIARCPAPLLASVGGVALALGGLLVGYEPVGNDPAWMYRPIKNELARAMRSGGLPFWSDRFGVGVPLVAESHAAAFYPPNWLLYRALEVPVAYRLAMWLHCTAIAGLTYWYAGTLGLRPWGRALAALSFALCGFQAGHAVHEPIYHALPYLLLSLILAEGYLARGGAARPAALALVLGAALTVGHFQIQCWTAGLVLLTASWRALGGEAPWRRVAAMAGAVGWAVAVAAVQLATTWELVRFTGFSRSMSELFMYAFPPAHWAQLAFPGIFQVLPGPERSAYWFAHATSGREASLHVGIVPLIFAGIGLFARKDRSMILWCGLAAAGFALATLPICWRQGYTLLLRIPGLDLFRCPARYTMLTSLGLCLLAGLGFDRLHARRSFLAGFILAAVFAGCATAWIVAWPSDTRIFAGTDGDDRVVRIAAGIGCWLAALGLVAAWRAGRVAPAIALLAAACELTFWFYNGPTQWGRAVPIPGASPVLARLARESGVGLVGGLVAGLPVLAGWTTGNPYLGIPGPEPNPRLDLVGLSWKPGGVDLSYYPRLGVTHGIFEGPGPILPGEVLYRGPDPVLDLVLPRKEPAGPQHLWRLDRYRDALPVARAATRAQVVPDWSAMRHDIRLPSDPDLVSFRAVELPSGSSGPRARSARVVRWDGYSGEVEHDGTCDLVLRRACYPGWTARIDGGREVPIVPADGGLQSIRLEGSGVTRVEVSYRPTLLRPAAAVSLAAIVAAAGVLMGSAAIGPSASRGQPGRPGGRGRAGGPG